MAPAQARVSASVVQTVQVKSEVAVQAARKEVGVAMSASAQSTVVEQAAQAAPSAAALQLVPAVQAAQVISAVAEQAAVIPSPDGQVPQAVHKLSEVAVAAVRKWVGVPASAPVQVAGSVTASQEAFAEAVPAFRQWVGGVASAPAQLDPEMSA